MTVPFLEPTIFVELLDILADAGAPLPPDADTLDELTPYAVEFRYGFVEPAGLDRNAVKRAVEEVRVWAEQGIKDP